MLRVYRDAEVIGGNRAAPDGSHDADQNISWTHGVPTEGLILRFRDVPRLRPSELIGHDIVDPQHRNPLVYELSMEQVTPERTRSYRSRSGVNKLGNRCARIIARSKAAEKLFFEQCPAKFDQSLPPNAESIGLVEDCGDAALLGERREGETESGNYISSDASDRDAAGAAGEMLAAFP
jgi:hypothetical protein